MRRLLEDARHLHGIDLALVVEPTDQHVSVSIAFGGEAVLLVADVHPMAAAFTAVRPWVPIVVGTGESRRVAFGCVRSAS